MTGTCAIFLCAVAMADESVESPVVLDPVVVSGDHEDLAASPSPRLVYSREDFERFEPQTAGDILRRLPGVVFSSDAGEYDEVRFRGLDSGYTQILIDGQRVPGVGNNRSVLVDRIAAERIERIEIVRSPDAGTDAEGVAGTINIVLRAPGSVPETGLRTGIVRAQDGAIRGTGSLTQAGQSGRLQWTGSIDLQGAHTRQHQPSRIEGADHQTVRVRNEEEIVDAHDGSADGRADYSLASAGTLEVSGRYQKNRRDSDQEAPGFVPDAGAEVFDGLDFEIENENERLLGLSARWDAPTSPSREASVLATFDRLAVDGTLLSGESDDSGLQSSELDDNRVRDRGGAFDARLVQRVGATDRIKGGVRFGIRRREAAQRVTATDEDGVEDPTGGLGAFTIDETRLDFFVGNTWEPAEGLTTEVGGRLERALLDQTGSDLDGSRLRDHGSESHFCPDAHALWAPTLHDDFRLSYARTVRRPDFDQLVPFRQRMGRRFVVGNPGLGPERADGFDAGFEHRWNTSPYSVGINLFHRKLHGLIEEVRAAPRTVTPDNVGTGRTWGAELDASMSLAAVGLPDVSVLGNLTFLHSSVRDPITGQSSAFQLQPNHFGNVSAEYRPQGSRFAYGATLQKQGPAHESLSDETSRISFEPRVDAFVEVHVTRDVVLRLNGNNLLNQRQREVREEYGRPRPAGKVETTEYETLTIGPSVLLTLRTSY